jgi:hypothetical protein
VTKKLSTVPLTESKLTITETHEPIPIPGVISATEDSYFVKFNLFYF